MQRRILRGLLACVLLVGSAKAALDPALVERAEKGDAEAQLNLGLIHARGDGVPADMDVAVKWFRKAAGQGNSYAQFNLGVAYFNGTGAPKDSVEAVKWYRLAAEQREAFSHFLIGKHYFEGNGVTKDYVEAHAWTEVAAAMGQKLAKELLPLIEYHMTREQMAEAAKLAKERFEKINKKT